MNVAKICTPSEILFFFFVHIFKIFSLEVYMDYGEHMIIIQIGNTFRDTFEHQR